MSAPSPGRPSDKHRVTTGRRSKLALPLLARNRHAAMSDLSLLLGPARRRLRVRREFAPLTPRPRAFIGSFASLMAFKLCTCMSDIGISRTFIDAFASSAPTIDIDQPSGPEREQNAFGGLTVEGDSHD